MEGRKLCARADPKPVTDPKAIDQVVTSNVAMDTNPSALDVQPVICAKVQDSSPQCQESRHSEHPVHTCEEEGSTSIYLLILSRSISDHHLRCGVGG